MSDPYCTPHAMLWHTGAQKVALRSFRELREDPSRSGGAGGDSSHRVGVVTTVITGDCCHRARVSEQPVALEPLAGGTRGDTVLLQAGQHHVTHGGGEEGAPLGVGQHPVRKQGRVLILGRGGGW